MDTFFEFLSAEVSDNCQTTLQEDAGVVQARTLWHGPGGGSIVFEDHFLPGMQLTSMRGQLTRPLQAELGVLGPWVAMLYQFDGDLRSRQCARRPMRLSTDRQNLIGDEAPRNHYTFSAAPQGFSSFCVHLKPEFFQQLVQSNAEWMRVHEQRLHRLEPFLLTPEGVPATAATRALVQQIEQCPYSGPLKKMFLEARFLDLFVEQQAQFAKTLLRLSTKERDLFYAIRDFLDQHYTNPPSLLQLARLFGTNDFKLKKGFKQLFGTTVFGYVAERRLSVAQQLLTLTETPIQEIADSVGFINPAHFATAFRRKFGVAPSQVRRAGNRPTEPAAALAVWAA